MQKQQAFTVIELVVVMALLAVLMTMAAPSFTEMYRHALASSTVNSFVAALQTAKNEAIKNNLNSYVMPLQGNSWNSGWRVFVDQNFDGNFTPGIDLNILENEIDAQSFIIQGNSTAGGNSPYISFDGSGYPRITLGLTISIQQIGKKENTNNNWTRNVIISKIGRIRTCDPLSNKECKE